MSESQEPVWLSALQVVLLQGEALRSFGGPAGIRDIGLLESAVARPRQRHAHDEQATIFDLAALYAHGIARNHAFVDGNKRTALLAIRVFLYRNGHTFEPVEVDAVTTTEAVAEGAIEPALLADWIRANSRPRQVPGT